MVAFRVGAENAMSRDRRSGELRRYVVQDDEIDCVLSQSRDQAAEQQYSPFESVGRRWNCSTIEQHGNIDVALAMLSPARVAAEQIGRDHSVGVLPEKLLENDGEVRPGHATSIAGAPESLIPGCN